ncbi:MAG: hypothetical protein ACREJX_02630, partial [Polyangiaceae bacterium]
PQGPPPGHGPVSSPLPQQHSSTTSMTNAKPTVPETPGRRAGAAKWALLAGVAVGCLVVGAGLAVVVMKIFMK